MVLASLVLMTAPAIASTPGSAGIYRLSPALVARVENVPVAALLKAARTAGHSVQAPVALPARAKALTSHGKPEILYVGANYCPFCAAERWAMVMALSKFGTFHGLKGTASSVSDTNPATPTFTFYGSTYKSPYLAFVPVETAGSIATGPDKYPKLQSLSPSQSAIMKKWDAPPYVPAEYAGAFPFMDLGGRYVVIGSQYEATHIAGWTFSRAASYLASGDNSTSRAAEAAAGTLTKAICALTKGRPASVCKGLAGAG